MSGELLALAERLEKCVLPAITDEQAEECAAIQSALCQLMTGQPWDAHSPDYLGSLDAAMALVPKGCEPLLWWGERHGKGMATAEIGDMAAIATTPALALTAACLRARAAKKG